MSEEGVCQIYQEYLISSSIDDLGESLGARRETCAYRDSIGARRETCAYRDPIGARRETCAYWDPIGARRETCAYREPDGRHAPIGVKKDSAPIAQSVVYTMA